MNLLVSDSSAVLKLQEHLREHRKQLEYERNQKMLLESKQKQMNKDKAEMQKLVFVIFMPQLRFTLVCLFALTF